MWNVAQLNSFIARHNWELVRWSNRWERIAQRNRSSGLTRTMGITLARDCLKQRRGRGPLPKNENNKIFFLYIHLFLLLILLSPVFWSRGAQPQPRRVSALWEDSTRRYNDNRYADDSHVDGTILFFDHDCGVDKTKLNSNPIKKYFSSTTSSWFAHYRYELNWCCVQCQNFYKWSNETHCDTKCTSSFSWVGFVPNLG